jgi:hypothetical protein
MIKSILCYLFHRKPALFAEGGTIYEYFFSTKCCGRVFSVSRENVEKMNDAFDRVEWFSKR